MILAITLYVYAKPFKELIRKTIMDLSARKKYMVDKNVYIKFCM